MEVLTDVDVRVLGSLIEKEITTPDNYPLSLNALVNACNQSSNRDPVVQYDEPTVKAAVDRLRRYSLVRSMQRSGERVMKYMHLAGEAMEIDRAQLAVLDVLMLRGPRTLGEIRTQAGRMYDFQSLGDVEATLDGLATRALEPLVTKLPRQPGQKEARYAHLLSGEVSVETAPAPTIERDREPDRVPDRVPDREPDRVERLERTVEELRGELAVLRSEIAELKRVFE